MALEESNVVGILKYLEMMNTFRNVKSTFNNKVTCNYIVFSSFITLSFVQYVKFNSAHYLCIFTTGWDTIGYNGASSFMLVFFLFIYMYIFLQHQSDSTQKSKSFNRVVVWYSQSLKNAYLHICNTFAFECNSK